MPDAFPAREGRFWRFPDGTRLPVISGGQEGDPPKDPPTDPPADPDALGDAGKRALEAERQKARDEKKRADDLAAKLAEIENAGKSELQRLQEQAEQATKRAEAAEASALRHEIAAAKGLTPAQAKRLVGATREELEADADEILEAFMPSEVPPSAPPSARPSPVLKGGTDPSTDPVETDVAKLAEFVPRP